MQPPCCGTSRSLAAQQRGPNGDVDERDAHRPLDAELDEVGARRCAELEGGRVEPGDLTVVFHLALRARTRTRGLRARTRTRALAARARGRWPHGVSQSWPWGRNIRAWGSGYAARMADIDETASAGPPGEIVSRPAEIVRLTSTAREVLAELRKDGLDRAARSRVEAVYEQSLTQLSTLLSSGLQTELSQIVGAHRTERSRPTDVHETSMPSVSPEPSSTPALSTGELRVAEAQLAGWLDGLLLAMDESLAAEMQHAESVREAERQEPARKQAEVTVPDNSYL